MIKAKPVLINEYRACTFVLLESSKYTYNNSPLDLNVFNSKNVLSGIWSDEQPAVLYDSEKPYL